MKRAISILLTALLLLVAVPTFAAGGELQAGLYVSDAGTEVLYLDEAGVGVLNIDKEDDSWANGVLWTGTTLEIERQKVPFGMNDDMLFFTFDDQVLFLRYKGETTGYALGEWEQTSFAGTYTAEDGKRLTLDVDGRGVYTGANGDQDVFWGPMDPYWDNTEYSCCFLLFDSYLTCLYLTDDGAVMQPENEPEITFQRMAAPAVAAINGLKAGLYSSDSELMYLYDEGMGILIFQQDGLIYANGVVWTEDALEIERIRTPFLVKDDMVTFTYGDAVRMMTYSGPADEYALGERNGTAFAGTYTADGKTLSLTADGNGVYTDAAGATDVFWGSYAAYLEGQADSACFILYGSFMGSLNFEGETVVVQTENEGNIVFRREASAKTEPAPAPTATGELYYGYKMTSDGQSIELIPFMSGMGMDPRDIFLEMRADGTGRIQIMDPEDAAEFTWTNDTFIYEGQSISYTRQGTHILLDMEGESIEFAPAAEMEALMGNSGTPDVTNGTAPTANADLIGTWNFTKARAMGMEIPASMMGTTMTVVLNADGTGSLGTDGSSNAVDWTLQDDQVVLSIAGQEIITLIYDGTVLTLDTGSASVELILEKDA